MLLQFNTVPLVVAPLALWLAACAPGPVLSPAQVKVVPDAPAFACVTLGVIVAEVQGGAALPEADAREAAMQALRQVAADQSNDTLVYDGHEVQGDDLLARGRAFDCSIPSRG